MVTLVLASVKPSLMSGAAKQHLAQAREPAGLQILKVLLVTLPSEYGSLVNADKRIERHPLIGALVPASLQPIAHSDAQNVPGVYGVDSRELREVDRQQLVDGTTRSN